jgi:hypothetical protein
MQVSPAAALEQFAAGDHGAVVTGWARYPALAARADRVFDAALYSSHLA